CLDSFSVGTVPRAVASAGAFSSALRRADTTHIIYVRTECNSVRTKKRQSNDVRPVGLESGRGNSAKSLPRIHSPRTHPARRIHPPPAIPARRIRPALVRGLAGAGNEAGRGLGGIAAAPGIGGAEGGGDGVDGVSHAVGMVIRERHLRSERACQRVGPVGLGGGGHGLLASRLLGGSGRCIRAWCVMLSRFGS